MEPIVVLREEDNHLPSLLFPGHELAPGAAMDAACAWLESNGVGEAGIFTARHEGAPIHERVNAAWWGGFERGFVQAHHEGAQAVTAVYLPRVAIPMPSDPSIAGHPVGVPE